MGVANPGLLDSNSGGAVLPGSVLRLCVKCALNLLVLYFAARGFFFFFFFPLGALVFSSNQKLRFNDLI